MCNKAVFKIHNYSAQYGKALIGGHNSEHRLSFTSCTLYNCFLATNDVVETEIFSPRRNINFECDCDFNGILWSIPAKIGYQLSSYDQIRGWNSTLDLLTDSFARISARMEPMRARNGKCVSCEQNGHWSMLARQKTPEDASLVGR